MANIVETITTTESLTPNAFYLIDVNVTVANGEFDIHLGENLDADNLVTETSISTSGTHQYIKRLLDTANSSIIFSTTTEFNGTINQISLKEIPGNHLHQDVVASQMTYRVANNEYWLENDGSDSYDVDFDSAVTGSLSFGNEYATLTYGVNYSSGVNDAFAGIREESKIYGLIFTENDLYTDDKGFVFNRAIENNGGSIEKFATYGNLNDYWRDNNALVKVPHIDTSGVADMSDAFIGCSNLEVIDSKDWDTSSVTSFGAFARDCSSLTTLDVSNWDTSSVTEFGAFALFCSSLTELNVSNWDTSFVTNFSNFVRASSSLTTLDVSNWDTSSVTFFGGFALNCSSLTTLNVSNWDTSFVTNFSNFVRASSSLTTLDVSNWDTSSVTFFGGFALNCSSLTTITVTGGTGNPFADSPCTDYTQAFENCALNQESVDNIILAIEAANTSNGTLDIDGGTNAAPSNTIYAEWTTDAQTAVTNLQNRGWTVNTN